MEKKERIIIFFKDLTKKKQKEILNFYGVRSLKKDVQQRPLLFLSKF